MTYLRRVRLVLWQLRNKYLAVISLVIIAFSSVRLLLLFFFFFFVWLLKSNVSFSIGFCIINSVLLLKCGLYIYVVSSNRSWCILHCFVSSWSVRKLVLSCNCMLSVFSLHHFKDFSLATLLTRILFA